MYAIIKNNQIIWFSDEQITEENMEFDELIEWDFDTQKQYIFENWEVKENIIELDEKQEKIRVLLEKAKEWEELRTKYLSTELLPESEARTEKLRILHEKGQDVMTQYLQLENELVEKYWIEILQDIL